MRVAWMAAAVGGLAAIASGQSNFSFQSVFENQVTDGADAVDVTGLYQVVLHDDDHVAARAAIPGEGDQDDAIIYSAPTSTQWESGVIVKRNDLFWGAASGQFDALGDIAVTSGAGSQPRIHFAGANQAAQYGLFQYDVDGAVTNALIDGSAYGDSEAFRHDVQTGYMSYQVNAQGQMALAGKAGAREVVVRMNGAVRDELASNSDGISDFVNHFNKRLITSGGQAVLLANREVSPGVFRNPDLAVIGSTGPSFPLPETFFDDYEPERVLAANDSHVIFQAIHTDGTYATVLTGDSGQTILGAYPADTLVLTPEAVLTGNGRAAFYTPASTVDVDDSSLQYIDLGVSGSATPQWVAGIGTDLPGDMEIKYLAGDGFQVPMINDNGVVVFDAVVGPQDGGDDPLSWRLALLAWMPGGDLSIVAQVGQSIEIEGEEVIVQTLALNPLTSPFDGGIYKDGLNNDNRLAFGLQYYTDPQDPEGTSSIGVIITTVPEPTALAMSGLILAGVGLRRRRR